MRLNPDQCNNCHSCNINLCNMYLLKNPLVFLQPLIFSEFFFYAVLLFHASITVPSALYYTSKIKYVTFWDCGWSTGGICKHHNCVQSCKEASFLPGVFQNFFHDSQQICKILALNLYPGLTYFLLMKE